jgi:glyoxylase-like metal-dependent hydrolase (beta-lactamase superfamily II)
VGELNLYLLSGGTLDADRSVIHPGDDSHRRVTLPCMQVLLERDGHAVLIDTGLPPSTAGGPDALHRDYDIDPSWIRPNVAAEERVDRQLRLAGFDPAHLEQEYLPVWDAPGLQFRPVQGDWSPMPGVEMLLTPGHTPGHQSMLVRLGKQPWLFTWDAVYTEEHWRTGKLGAVADVTSARNSIARLHQIAKDEKARVIFGHDIVQWAALGMADRARPRLMTP